MNQKRKHWLMVSERVGSRSDDKGPSEMLEKVCRRADQLHRGVPALESAKDEERSH